jgi:hypothetical protein
MDHKRVYEKEELLSRCLVLVIQVTEVSSLEGTLSLYLYMNFQPSFTQITTLQTS